MVAMNAGNLYQPDYSNSWAIVIGINKYKSAPPLDYACNDAERFAATLKERFGFPDENVMLITDESATKDRILSEFLAFANGKAEPDDRLIFFFAGHGHTQTGKRGEIGFLVPVDGQTANLASLIPWDELTRSAELISAKHILYIMDACYGGLAVSRYLPPGSMRFVKDMLQRYSRQVLTAGKADEMVADAGGPRPGHSVFSGHLLDALEGAAATSDGILTANGVMAYVYDRVAKDYQSQQTPHYGFLDGDGDMIFDLEPIRELIADSQKDKDVLVAIPITSAAQEDLASTESLADRVKEYLSDPRYKIKLNDLVTTEIRKVLSLTADDSFSVQDRNITPEEFLDRLKRYEAAVKDLVTIVVLLAHWGEEEHRHVLRQVFARLPDAHGERSGVVLWLSLRWYPVTLLMYAGGLAAIAANNYHNLATVLTTEVAAKYTGETTEPIIVPAAEGMLEVTRLGLFKLLPGHEKHFVPRSEYFFKVVQPMLDDLLFLGTSYERLFDRFEVFFALVVADQMYDMRESVWGPPGRFGWKRQQDNNPFSTIIAEAQRDKELWPPLAAGLFQGNYERFTTMAEGYQELLDELRWY